MNRLRLMSPIPWSEFEARTGVAANTLDKGMQQAAERGLVEITPGYWKLTNKGHMFVNDLLSQFC